jgi:hypothetical protein
MRLDWGIPVRTDNPKHPVYALTTYELRRYRRAIEHSLNGIPADAPVRERLYARLAEVVAEEECRAQLQQALAS